MKKVKGGAVQAIKCRQVQASSSALKIFQSTLGSKGLPQVWVVDELEGTSTVMMPRNRTLCTGNVAVFSCARLRLPVRFSSSSSPSFIMSGSRVCYIPCTWARNVAAPPPRRWWFRKPSSSPSVCWALICLSVLKVCLSHIYCPRSLVRKLAYRKM